MPASPRLKDLERRVWLRTFEHGLWDVAIGLLLLAFGIGILTEFYWLSAIVVPVGLPAMRDLARRIIVPRIGYATFKKRRQRSKTRIQVLLAVLALFGVAMFLVTGWSTQANAPAWLAHIRAHFLVVIGLIWGGALGVAGWAADFPRLYAYGGLVFVALLGADLAGGRSFGHALIGVGGLIALTGLALFARFVRRYPRRPTLDLGDTDA